MPKLPFSPPITPATSSATGRAVNNATCPSKYTTTNRFLLLLSSKATFACASCEHASERSIIIQLYRVLLMHHKSLATKSLRSGLRVQIGKSNVTCCACNPTQEAQQQAEPPHLQRVSGRAYRVRWLAQCHRDRRREIRTRRE